jgi:hypothetical protein
MLPTKFQCAACELIITSHAELQVAGIGGQYTRTRYFNPVEYYGEHVGADWEYDNE